MEETYQNKRSYHLAGIVPLAGPKLSFGFPWHDSMQPIAKDYLALERATAECAYAGCKTIWVVCNDDIQPLVRSRLGDFVEDPMYLDKTKFVKYPSEHRKQIPIFYCPIHPKDRYRRDSFAWSVLHGALSAFITSDKISKWVHPNKYYISFPYGLYDPQVVKKHRKRISSEIPFFLSYNGRTVSDGEYLGFTISPSEYKQYVYDAKRQCTGGSSDLPIEKRWSSRNFTLDKIFKPGIINKETVEEVEWYYRMDNWRGLLKYFASEHASELKRVSLLVQRRYNSIEEID